MEFNSEERKKLDEATSLITLKYDLLIDKEKLRMLRDQLLAEERQKLEERLQQLRGLVLIEGDWTVEANQDAYIFRQPFMENVTNPPVCDVKLLRNLVSLQDRDVIEGLSTKRMRISIFGNVLAGKTQESQTVFLTPIALF